VRESGSSRRKSEIEKRLQGKVRRPNLKAKDETPFVQHIDNFLTDDGSRLQKYPSKPDG
jgi:hypothetical protein